MESGGISTVLDRTLVWFWVNHDASVYSFLRKVDRCMICILCSIMNIIFVDILTVIFPLYCKVFLWDLVITKRMYCRVDGVEGYRKHDTITPGLLELLGPTDCHSTFHYVCFALQKKKKRMRVQLLLK